MFTFESFGAVLPDNWEEITIYLNGTVRDMKLTKDDKDAIEQVWEDYWEGKFTDAPKAIVDKDVCSDGPMVVAMKHYKSDDYYLYKAYDADGQIWLILQDAVREKYLVFDENVTDEDVWLITDKFNQFGLTEDDFWSTEWIKGDIVDDMEDLEFTELEELA